MNKLLKPFSFLVTLGSGILFSTMSVQASELDNCADPKFPEGSYWMSCINCQLLDNDQVLQADCRKGTDETYSSRTKIRLKAIENHKGKLQYN